MQAAGCFRKQPEELLGPRRGEIWNNGIICCQLQRSFTYSHSRLHTFHRVTPATQSRSCFDTPDPRPRPPICLPGYPFDLVPQGAPLQAYAVLVYHLPLSIAFTIRRRAPFVWGGCMMLRARELRDDRHGVLKVGARADRRLSKYKEAQHACRGADGLNVALHFRLVLFWALTPQEAISRWLNTECIVYVLATSLCCAFGMKHISRWQ